jgi:putative glycosyltransferase (TIGR04372 family)
MSLPGFNRVPRLTVPENDRDPAEAYLKERGLDPDRWFVCVYWREPGYSNRSPHSLRDILDPTAYMAVIEHVVENLGGQVVRLGHPTPTTLKAHPDIIDLAQVEDSLMTQITAISRARFFISSPSGPVTFGPGLGTPTAVTDNICVGGVWNDHDILYTQTIISPGGESFRQRSAFDAGLLAAQKQSNYEAMFEKGYRYVKNSSDDLIHVTEMLPRRTTDCLKWREPAPVPRATLSTRIPLPLQAVVKTSAFIDPPN